MTATAHHYSVQLIGRYGKVKTFHFATTARKAYEAAVLQNGFKPIMANVYVWDELAKEFTLAAEVV